MVGRIKPVFDMGALFHQSYAVFSECSCVNSLFQTFGAAVQKLRPPNHFPFVHGSMLFL